MYNPIQINGVFYSPQLAQTALAQLEPCFLKEVLSFFLEFCQESTLVFTTSGSTGTPKSLKFTKNQLLASAEITAKTFQLSASSTLLLCLPMQYVAAKLMVVRAVYLQCNLLVVEPSSNPWPQIPETIDFGAFVPLQIDACFKENFQTKLQKITTVIIGGAALNPKQLAQLNTFSNAIYQTYGMTETLTHVAVKLISQNTQNQHYSALKGISFSQNSNQCLVIHVPHIQPEPLETTDVVELHSEIEFTWLGRADGVINSGGIKLIPEQIEAKLQAFIPFPFFVGPKYSEKLGEELVVYVVVHPKEFTLNKEALKKALHKYEVPKEVIYCKAFHYTESGKIQRTRTQNDASLFF